VKRRRHILRPRRGGRGRAPREGPIRTAVPTARRAPPGRSACPAANWERRVSMRRSSWRRTPREEGEPIAAPASAMYELSARIRQHDLRPRVSPASASRRSRPPRSRVLQSPSVGARTRTITTTRTIPSDVKRICTSEKLDEPGQQRRSRGRSSSERESCRRWRRSRREGALRRPLSFTRAQIVVT